MAARKITWTTKANQERKEILDYWFKRNKSKTFGKKLNKLFIESLKYIAKNPGIGRKTSFEHVRIKIVRSYLLFYEFDKTQIKVLSVWDSRRDGNRLEVRQQPE